MSNYPSSFRIAGLRFLSVPAGVIMAAALAFGLGPAPAAAKHLDGVTDMLQARNADCDAGK